MGQKHTALSPEISLNNKSLREVPSNKPLSDYIRLRKIDLSKNLLTLIPYTICKSLQDKPRLIDTLEDLDLSNNRLTTVPVELCLLLNLKRLKLDNNLLSELPLHFHALYKLEKLTLNHNILSVLPPKLSNLKKLKILRLDSNQLKYIPNDVSELPALKELTIHNNPLPQEILEEVDLEAVLVKFREQPVPPEYKKLLKLVKKAAAPAPKSYDEIKGDKINVFKHLLSEPRGRSAFMSFLEKQYAAENLQFYIAVEDFKTKFNSESEITTDELIEAADVIYHKYIDEKTDKQINIPDEVKKKVVALWNDSFNFPRGVNQWVFNESHSSVLKLMFTDKLHAFALTDEGRALWTEFDR